MCSPKTYGPICLRYSRENPGLYVPSGCLHSLSRVIYALDLVSIPHKVTSPCALLSVLYFKQPPDVYDRYMYVISFERAFEKALGKEIKNRSLLKYILLQQKKHVHVYYFHSRGHSYDMRKDSKKEILLFSGHLGLLCMH